jgi:hypothetical protein
MATFTFITDFCGGTYICQKEGADVLNVLPQWRDDILQGAYVANMDIEEFSKAYEFYCEEFRPSPYAEVVNVWGFDFLVGGKHMLELFIVKTDTAPGQ